MVYLPCIFHVCLAAHLMQNLSSHPGTITEKCISFAFFLFLISMDQPFKNEVFTVLTSEARIVCFIGALTICSEGYLFETDFSPNVGTQLYTTHERELSFISCTHEATLYRIRPLVCLSQYCVLRPAVDLQCLKKRSFTSLTISDRL